MTRDKEQMRQRWLRAWALREPADGTPGLTYPAIGAQLGVSRERARQLARRGQRLAELRVGAGRMDEQDLAAIAARAAAAWRWWLEGDPGPADTYLHGPSAARELACSDVPALLAEVRRLRAALASGR